MTKLKVDNGAYMIPDSAKLKQYGIVEDSANRPRDWPDWHDILVMPENFKIFEESDDEIVFIIPGGYNAIYNKEDLTFNIVDDLDCL